MWVPGPRGWDLALGKYPFVSSLTEIQPIILSSEVQPNLKDDTHHFTTSPGPPINPSCSRNIFSRRKASSRGSGKQTGPRGRDLTRVKLSHPFPQIPALISFRCSSSWTPRRQPSVIRGRNEINADAPLEQQPCQKTTHAQQTNISWRPGC